MTYSLVPNTGETLDGTRDQIRTNFEIIRTAQNLNHGDFDAANQGKHKFLQMPNQGSAPTTAADESGFYAADDANSVSQLFFRGENDGSSYQLTLGTSGVDANIATFGTNTTYQANHEGGWTFLPGGLIMMYGKRLVAGSSGILTFPFAFPSGNAPFLINISPLRNQNATFRIERLAPAPSDSSFTYNFSSGGASTQFFWQAIGN